MIRIGILGMGFMGRTHYEAYARISGAQVVAVAAPEEGKVRHCRPGLKVYRDHRELLSNSRVDVVDVCLPTALHEEAVLAAAGAGCHVICEKPFAFSARSAERMLGAVRAAGVTLMVGQVVRFWPEYRRIKELVDSGAIGVVQSISSYRLATLPAWAPWFSDPSASGGGLLDLQIHDMDFIHWILGHPRTVFTAGLQSAKGSWDHVFTTLSYRGAVASIESSYLMPPTWPFSAGVRVSGSAGCLEHDFRVESANIEGRGRPDSSLVLYGGDGAVTRLEVPCEDSFVAELGYFLGCLTRKESPRVCPPEESVQVMRVMDASRESVEEGRIVELATT